MKPDLNGALIVGFGSPFGDDRFGWLVIEQLQKALDGQEAIKATCCDRSGIDWIHQYQSAEQLVFIDAVKSDAAPGTLHHLTLTPTAFDTLPSSYSSHGLGLREGLAIAAEVIELPPEIEFYGVELSQCDANNIVVSTIIKQAGLVSKQLLEKLSPPQNSKTIF